MYISCILLLIYSFSSLVYSFYIEALDFHLLDVYICFVHASVSLWFEFS